jgi:hypothetical protein
MPMPVDACSPSEIKPWGVVWAALANRIDGAVEKRAMDYNLDRSALKKLVLLHAPRFTFEEVVSPDTLDREVDRLAHRMSEMLCGYREMDDRPRIASLSRIDVRLGLVPDSLARLIHERFHYLGTPRDGCHFGLYHVAEPDIPAGLATVSPLDVDHLRARIEPVAEAEQGSIVSRVFAFPWAPRNTISFLLGSIVRQIRSERAGRGVVFTYVNPNLGFRATSYRAANWRPDGVQPLVYRYLDGNYVTARTADVCVSEITRSKFQLDPLQVWRMDW